MVRAWGKKCKAHAQMANAKWARGPRRRRNSTSNSAHSSSPNSAQISWFGLKKSKRQLNTSKKPKPQNQNQNKQKGGNEMGDGPGGPGSWQHGICSY
jgi:hypothetical protein